LPATEMARSGTTRRLSLLAVTLTSVAAALALGVVPVRDWLGQRVRTADLQAQVEEVEALNSGYEDRIDALNTDEEIERRARSDYNLVMPDEEAYAVVPPPSVDYPVPRIWPFGDWTG